MLPSALTAEEIETIINCLDTVWQFIKVDREELARISAAREKLLRYLRDESCWHGRVG